MTEYSVYVGSGFHKDTIAVAVTAGKARLAITYTM